MDNPFRSVLDKDLFPGQDRGNNWLAASLLEPEQGRYYLQCEWCYKYDQGFNWKHTSPGMFVDANDPFTYPLPPYICDPCKVIRGPKQLPRLIRYSEYLTTGHWVGIRSLALRRAGHKCQLCSSREKLQVHHNNYSRLWCERPEDVIVLCDSCHEKHHNKGSK